MRIAFVGKGGSGKTTLSTLASLLLAEDAHVLAIDADINQHLAESLAVDSPPSLSSGVESIKSYLRGSNSRLPDNSFVIKTTPPGSGSRLLRIDDTNPIFESFSTSKGNLKLMVTGPFDASDIGTKCYHSKVGAAELVLNHLIDGEGQYVVVDMTAGADSFASGMFTKFDATFIVCEPTKKAVAVYQQYKEHAREYGVRLRVIANKIESEDDLNYVMSEVGDDYFGAIYRSDEIKKAERYGELMPNKIEEQNRATLQRIKDYVDSLPKDWEKFYDQSCHFHVLNAKSWANVSTGHELDKTIDPEYDMISHLS